ncbi:hypothetical protein BK654_29570 [Pseudomonas brassicacearum]|uniref:Type III secretion protein n=1 Tax=Pseudomonas brassicacearum TaxID=930166 RepID=A0AAW8MBL0_9PSED|nr:MULTISPECIES: HrpT family type III secretion system protein [Pseudomonas]MDR6959527.1 hypothetical protein [Pseudomonas brassicacearum]ROM70033.1 hypothetical protein BK654_29570 [Pseudomonas brassicacearum]UZE15364.1 type III secretion protein [Pseudomonas sp. B21-054]
MTKMNWAAFGLLCVMLSGCSTTSGGCSGQSCDRPDSNNRELVIWWPADMRTGLENPQDTADYTIVPLRD